ncbi:MAG: TetR/AcrR family transcriptional regulator, partial [Candidatus Thiodiazotropha taylori]|nr:TetR/AcrR family transcriptional regulator [Candidatus Thiodiazotropha taylori]
MLHLKKTATEDLPVYDRILSTALDLFVERGYHNVSIHDIQKMANVSIGSIY